MKVQPSPEQLIDLTNNICCYLAHLALTRLSHEALKQSIENCADNECFLTLDFKQNIRLNQGPVLYSKAYYQQTQVSVLGFA